MSASLAPRLWPRPRAGVTLRQSTGAVQRAADIDSIGAPLHDGALAPAGTVLIAEALIEDTDHPTMPIRIDVAMMAYHDGAERSLDEYRTLLAEAELEIVDTTPINPVLAVLDARAA